MSLNKNGPLGDDLIHFISKDDRNLFYRFRLGVLQTEIELQLETLPGGATSFALSHLIKTPGQDAPYRTSRPWNDNPSAALQQAISGLTQHYKWAIDDGLRPNETWLVRS